jgi:hypothetical protein
MILADIPIVALLTSEILRQTSRSSELNGWFSEFEQ